MTTHRTALPRKRRGFVPARRLSVPGPAGAPGPVGVPGPGYSTLSVLTCPPVTLSFLRPYGEVVRVLRQVPMRSRTAKPTPRVLPYAFQSVRALLQRTGGSLQARIRRGVTGRMGTGAKMVVGTIVVGGLGASVFAAVTAAGGSDTEVDAVAVERGEIVDRALAVGRIEPLVEVSVKSQLAGVVRRMFKEPGEYVRQGEPLLEVQPNPTPIELVEARRNIELREIELQQLERRRDRLAELRDRDLASEQEFEDAEYSLSEVSLQLQIARERLALLSEGRVTIGDEAVETVIQSPIQGFILEKMVEIGDPVVPLTTFQEGTVLMTMAEMDELLFRGTVDEIDVGRLAEGMPVEVTIGALPDTRLDGRLTRISLTGRDEENATIFPVEIAVLPAEGTLLRAGYSANAQVIIERRSDILIIPERVVRFEEGGAFVTVRVGPEETEEREIRTGLSDGISVEVLEGLAEGERVMEPPRREIT